MWVQVLSTLIGLWMMAAPSVLNYRGTAWLNDSILGPIVATNATIAIWECTRALRWLNLPIGVWLLIAPWVFGYETAPLLNSLACGLLLIVFSRVKGEIHRRFGGGWSVLWGKPRPELKDGPGNEDQHPGRPPVAVMN